MRVLFQNMIFCISHKDVTTNPLFVQLEKIFINNNHILWELKPKAEISVSGKELSETNFKITLAVPVVMPATVFITYVEKELIPHSNYADNKYKKDEKLFNIPFLY